ncbi:MAG: hypothetical protein WD492_06970 [Alkalispirochaeta sp.]
MSEIEQNAKLTNGTLPPARPVPFDLRLRSLKSSRQSLARILRAWGRGEIDEATAKTACWLLSMYLGYLKAGVEEDIERQLKELEGRVRQIEKEKQYAGNETKLRLG